MCNILEYFFTPNLMNWNEYVQYICLLDKKALIFIMLIIMIEILIIGLIIDIHFKKNLHI